MKYFFDTEFIEGWKKLIKWLPTLGNFNKCYHSIQLISIGIVAEDGREYYAVSNEFNPNDANQWVKENVLNNIESDWYKKLTNPEKQWLYIGKRKRAFRNLQLKFGKSNKQIAEEIKEFCLGPYGLTGMNETGYLLSFEPRLNKQIQKTIPEFYAYYADYDWVLFCSIFGTMMDLPKGFPMYCIDLKQILDEKASDSKIFENDKSKMSIPLVYTFENRLKYLKSKVDYPKQENEHNALDDAKWNKKLYEFLISIK